MYNVIYINFDFFFYKLSSLGAGFTFPLDYISKTELSHFRILLRYAFNYLGILDVIWKRNYYYCKWWNEMALNRIFIGRRWSL